MKPEMYLGLIEILKKIKEYNTIVIARHIGPDPDALASQIALRDSIKTTFPKKKVFAVGSSVSKFRYFGELDRIDDNNLEKPLLIILRRRIAAEAALIRILVSSILALLREKTIVTLSALCLCRVIINLVLVTSIFSLTARAASVIM